MLTEKGLLYNSEADMLKAERMGGVKSIRYRQKCALDFQQEGVSSCMYADNRNIGFSFSSAQSSELADLP